MGIFGSPAFGVGSWPCKEFLFHRTGCEGPSQHLTKQLRDALAIDPELQKWLHFNVVPFSLAPGMACRVHNRWAVRIDSAVGDPFITRWKPHLLEQMQQQCGGPISGPAVDQSGGANAKAQASLSKGEKMEAQGDRRYLGPSPVTYFGSASGASG